MRVLYGCQLQSIWKQVTVKRQLSDEVIVSITIVIEIILAVKLGQVERVIRQAK